MPAAATPFNGGGASLRFPRELGSDEVPNYVTFRPTIVDFGLTNGSSSRKNYGNAFTATDFAEFKPRSFGAVGSTNSSGITFFNPFDQIKKKIGGFIDSISKKANLSFDTPFGNVGFNFGAAASGGSILSGRLNLGALNINLGSSMGKQGANTIRKLPGINLYLPQELKNTITGNYNTPSLGAAGQEAVNFAANGFDRNAGGELLSGMVAAALQDVMSDTLSNAVQVGTGRAKNNYTYAIFNGMKHREFSYNFTLVAKDAEESKQIKAICDAFTMYMLPIRSPDDFHFYDVPCMWEISYNRYSKKIDFIDQPNNCFLTSVDITYGKGAFGMTHDNGSPLTVDLALKFMELEPMVRADGDRSAGNSALADQIRNQISGGGASGGGGGK